MNGQPSIFLDFNLPNATTWFYFSLLLAVALFFKFSRLLSVRNWDVLTLFLLVPGLLLRQEANATAPQQMDEVGKPPAAAEPAAAKPPSNVIWFAYLWLLCGSGYFLVRCLADLALVRRPALHPNLNLGGLAWLGVALFVCLAAVALKRTTEPLTAGNTPKSVNSESIGSAEAPRLETAESPHSLLWTRRILAIVCHLAIVSALVLIGYWHFQDRHAGMAAATFYLLLPYTALFFDQVHQVVPMAFVLWAVAAHRLPTLSGLLLGLAAGSIYFPALLFPAWFSFYRRNGAGRFTLTFCLAAGLGLTITGLVLYMGGPVAEELRTTLHVFDWQQWKLPSTEGIWKDVHWAYRIPVFIAYLAFLVMTVFWPAPKNLAHLLALSAAVLIGIQFWFADRGGLYVLWYLPLMLLIVFRPNLSERLAAAIQPETDWLHRLKALVSRWFRRRVKQPEAMASTN